MRSLTSSCDEFPTSLVLLHTTPHEDTEVVGHSRLNILPREESCAWVESVVIRRELRGAGYGRLLMNKTEEYARVRGFTTIYLSTHDQQVFYGKLGYEFCAPVCIYGGSINRNLILKQFIVPDITKGVHGLPKSKGEIERIPKSPDITKQSISPLTTVPSSSVPPPPPPPPLPANSKLSKESITKIDPSSMSKMYMKKDL